MQVAWQKRHTNNPGPCDLSCVDPSKSAIESNTGLLCVTVSTFTHRSYKPVLVVSCLYPLVARTGVGLDLNDRSHPDITSHPMVAMMHGQSQMDADCLAFNKNTKLPAEDCIIAMPRPEQV